jgi:sugar O-acyltransferase (sialic acid O-acetyltransferase NeuD family)
LLLNSKKIFWKNISPKNKKIIMWGAGDQARVNLPILESIGCEVIAFVDSTPEMRSPVEGVPIFKNGDEFLSWIEKKTKKSNVGSVIAIGNPFAANRIEYAKFLKLHGITSESFADPSSRIRIDALIGEGVQVMPNVVINNHVRIANQCILNTGSIIEHDCDLSEGVEIGPGAILTGRVSVGENTWIGAGAIVLPRLKIGSNVVVGAGAIVTKNIEDNAVVVGNPARQI